MAHYNIPAPPALDLNDRNLYQGWTKFLQRFQNFEIATGVHKKDDTTRVATLLSVIGQQAVDTYNTFTWAEDGDAKRYVKVVDQFAKFCKGKKNVTYERYVFNCRNQREGETIDAFVTELKTLADTCEFMELKNSLIRDRIILGIRNTGLKQRLLRDPELTLDKAVLLIRASTTASEQVQNMSAASSAQLVSAVRPKAKSWHKQRTYTKPSTGRNNTNHNPGTDKFKQQKARSNTTCRNCGGTYPHDGACPAYGKTCNHCKKLNHFSTVCRSQPAAKSHVHAVNHDENTEQYSSSEDEYAFILNHHSNAVAKQPRVTVAINDNMVSTLIDTGASVNVMSATTFRSLNNKPKLQNVETKIYAYGSNTPIPVVGKTSMTVVYKATQIHSEFYITDGTGDTLLSFPTASSLNIVKVTYNVATGPTSTDNIINQYQDRFEGIGKLTGTKCKLHVDTSVTPVAQPHRRIPFHVRRKVEDELKRLQSLDIIEPVNDKPTPWISPIRVVPKPKNPDAIRLCIDMRAVNEAIARERHVTPTIDDIMAKLNGSQVFSKLDLNSGYHQIELDEESRYLTTFSTHAGLFQFKRLNFGVNSGAEQFQNIIQSALAGLPGVLNISDDILVYGKSTSEHHENLAKCLQRLREKNLTLNKAKCQFNTNTIEFFGHVFSAEGVSPSPTKVKALVETTPPSNKEDLRSFLGLATYCARFIPRLAMISEPLRALTKESSAWKWGKQQQDAMDSIKRSITDHCKIAYFNPESKTEIVVDASPIGLCALLVQHDTTGKSVLVAVASRSLTPVEQRYSQTEREALAVTWGIVHFRLYVFGSPFTVITDHKPLVPIFNNSYSNPPTRIERWLLKLQQYSFTVEYKPGKTNPADYLSRHPLTTTQHPEPDAEEHINFIIKNAVPKSLTMSEIQDATKKDTLIQFSIQAVKTNTWRKIINEANANLKSDLTSMFHVRNELSINDTADVLLRDHRIVIPTSLQQRVIDIAHEGHQGIVKTKQLLRQKVWFSGIDHMVERTVSECLPCQATTPERGTSKPLHMSDLPMRHGHMSALTSKTYQPVNTYLS